MFKLRPDRQSCGDNIRQYRTHGWDKLQLSCSEHRRGRQFDAARQAQRPARVGAVRPQRPARGRDFPRRDERPEPPPPLPEVTAALIPIVVPMSIEMTAGVLVARQVEGMRFALGPTMAVRRECVEEIGGFGVLGQYCADDFVLGNRIAANGHKVVLSDHAIDHIVLHTGFLQSMKHQARWMKV